MSTSSPSLIQSSICFANRLLADPKRFKLAKNEQDIPVKFLVKALLDQLPDAAPDVNLARTLFRPSSYPGAPINLRSHWILQTLTAKKLKLASFVINGLLEEPVSGISPQLKVLSTELSKLQPYDLQDVDLRQAVATFASITFSHFLSSLRNTYLDDKTSLSVHLEKTYDLIHLLSVVYRTETLDVLMQQVSRGDWIEAKRFVVNRNVFLTHPVLDEMKPWLIASSNHMALSFSVSLPEDQPKPNVSFKM